MKIIKLNKRTAIYLILLILVLIASSFYLLATQGNKKFDSDEITFSYPVAYKSFDPPKDSQKNLVNIALLYAKNPDRLLRASKETNAKLGADLTHANFLDYLENNAEKSFPSRYPGFQKISTERTKISSRDASILSFSYIGGDGKTPIFVRYLIITADSNALYIYVQSSDEKSVKSDSAEIQKTLKIKS